MKKKIGILLAVVLIVTCLVSFAAISFANETDGQTTITVSYMKEQNTTSDTTTLDTVAYEGGKQVVGVGEKFTLPTTANSSYAGQDGFQLVWYTEDGRTYKAGEEVAFDKDTKLFRCVAKEVYTMSDLNYAMCNESSAAIVMTDITSDVGISVWNQGQSVLILNGFTLNISKNGSIMGGQRSGKHIYGEGTINATNPNGKLGEYSFFQDQSHGYNGSANRTVVGRDVTINAPNFWLGSDGDGSYNNHYPWTRIYGTVKLYGLYSITNTGNRAPFIEIYENANITITGTRLFNENAWRANGKYTFNHQSFEMNIYGGTFNLPAEAADRNFWTNDYLEDYVSGSNNYFNYGLNENTKDKINIYGGSFVLPENATPAIAEYLKVDSLGTIPSGGNGILAKKDTSTYHVAYGTRPVYKLAFEKYTDTYTKLTVTDYVDGSLTGTYYYTYTAKVITFIDPATQEEKTFTIADELKAYELNSETQEYTETDKFALDFGMNGSVIFSNDYIKSNGKLYSFEADGKTYQTVVPADCEHSFTGVPVNENCQHTAYADYNCSICAYNVYFSWGEKLGHDYVLGEHIEATDATLGSKTYTCSSCGNTVTRAYSLDPQNLDIKVTIRHDDETFEDVVVKASEVFEISSSGSDGDYIYTICGIKAFGEYSIRNIYGISIPRGILYFNLSTNNYEKYNNVEYGIVKLTIAENAVVNIQNIGNLRFLQEIVVEKNTDVIFGASCSWYSPNNEQRKTQNLKTIDLSAGNHKVNFVSACFEGRDTISAVKFGENAEYSIGYRTFYNNAIAELAFPKTSKFTLSGTYAFYGNDMTELVFPDGVDFIFPQSTFENCPNLASITFGENANYDIGAYTFLYSAVSKVAFAPNSTYVVNNRAFLSTNLSELDMSAGNMTVTLNKESFCCWQSNKKYCELSSIKFGENSTYIIREASLSDTSVTSLVLAPNSTYTFQRYAINGGNNKTEFLELDASADNINVTFEGDSLRDKNALATLKLNGKNSTYKLSGSSFYNTAISEIVLGEGSTYVFDNCFNGSTPIASVDASADNINVTFNNSVFNGKTALSTLLINGKNGTYNFAGDSFKKTIITELVLGEGSTYTFNNSAFNEVSTLERIDASANNVTVEFKDYIFNGKNKLSVLDISGENSTYTFGRESFKNTIIEELKFGNGSTYTFGYKVFEGNSVLKTLDFTASNVTATFNQEAFTGRTSVEYLAFGENSTYDIVKYAFYRVKATNDLVFSNTSTFKIGEKAFYESSFASIKFEDDVDVTFTGNQAFQYATSVQLYLGDNFKLDYIPFQDMKYLEKLVIMEGVTFKDNEEDYFFSQAGAQDFTTPLVVYNHSTDFIFSQRMFNNCDGIVLYTITDNIGERTDVFRDCNDGNGYKGWTVILGIPHKLAQGYSEPTCTILGGTNWIGADCDCGIVYREELNINVYENKHNITADTEVARVDTYTIEPIAVLGHDKGDFITIVYENGYISAGYAQYNCKRCMNAEGLYEEEVKPLIVSLGYSVSEFGDTASITQGYYINEEEFQAYKNICPDLTYGIIVIGNQTGEGMAPLTINEGVITNAAGGYHYNFGTFINNFFDIKVKGITNKTADSTIVFCAYIYDGSKFSYADNGVMAETVVGASYNSIVALQG